jgi:hypothetical protein
MTVEALNARIQELEAARACLDHEIAALKRTLRAKLGGKAAAGSPRTRRHSDEKICAVFVRHEEERRRYGALKAAAEELGVSTKTVSRALARRE